MDVEHVNAVRWGFLLGAVFALVVVTSDAMWVLAIRATAQPQFTPVQRLWLAGNITFVGIGLVLGGVAAARLRSRRFGLGILLGLVITLPVSWLLVAVSMWGGE